ncbi:hypothetical protein PYW07_009472 [Mythimna separata]|uniref:SHSP domain-containing protein n=1 Tax=Mythimna separata TaxID=271217 RepID=A0AAD8DN81_MYTSE|nr:hypothetical protein PYW07_009472 [Mythimna separata]
MSSNALTKPSKQNALAQIKHNIPIQLTDLSIFDNSYAHMRDRFTQEMKRIDQQMLKFSKDLSLFIGETSNSGYKSPESDQSSHWQVLQTSPLVIGEGQEKKLMLQFDVSSFEPAEIKVKLVNDMLIITAIHEEKTNDTSVYREYNRQFKMPPGIDPDSLVSSLSRDGVLTVQAPLQRPSSPSLED